MTPGDDLLAQAIEAHGGLARWAAARELVVRARSGGVALPSRGQWGVLPTRRRVLPRTGSGRPRPFPTLVWIEVDDVAVRDQGAGVSGPAS